MAANAQLELAKNLLALGKAEQAAQEASEACAVAGALRARDPNVVRWRTLQTNCLSMRARLALAAGATAQALELSEQALASARSERSGDPVEDRYVIAATARMIGDVHRRMGDADGATAAWTQGLTQLPPNVTERPWEMNERVELLRRVGRANEAAEPAGRLRTMGYRPPA